MILALLLTTCRLGSHVSRKEDPRIRSYSKRLRKLRDVGSALPQVARGHSLGFDASAEKKPRQKRKSAPAARAGVREE